MHWRMSSLRAHTHTQRHARSHTRKNTHATHSVQGDGSGSMHRMRRYAGPLMDELEEVRCVLCAVRMHVLWLPFCWAHCMCVSCLPFVSLVPPPHTHTHTHPFQRARTHTRTHFSSRPIYISQFPPTGGCGGIRQVPRVSWDRPGLCHHAGAPALRQGAEGVRELAQVNGRLLGGEIARCLTGGRDILPHTRALEGIDVLVFS